MIPAVIINAFFNMGRSPCCASASTEAGAARYEI
jgi:hypothetical protein